MTKSSSLSFASYAAVYETMHIKDYTEAEIAACWYTDSEKKLIKLEIRNTKMLMDITQNIDNDVICTRGLECLYMASSKKCNYTKVFRAVMIEQELQHLENSYDPEVIAEVCMKETRGSKELAKIMGYADQEWVGMTIAQQARRKTMKLEHPKSSDISSVLITCAVSNRRNTVLSSAA